jgi:hypothetical protein
MDFLNTQAERLFVTVPWQMAASVVLGALSVIVEGRPGHYPTGVRVWWEAHWLEVRSGKFRWTLLSLFRLTFSLCWLEVLTVMVIAIVNTAWGLFLFASPIVAGLIWLLISLLSVRTVRVDAQTQQIVVRSGILIPFVRRTFPLTDFTSVVVYAQKGGVFTARVSYRIRLDGPRRPLEIDPYGRYDHRQARRLAHQTARVADLLPVQEVER